MHQLFPKTGNNQQTNGVFCEKIVKNIKKPLLNVKYSPFRQKFTMLLFVYDKDMGGEEHELVAGDEGNSKELLRE